MSVRPGPPLATAPAAAAGTAGLRSGPGLGDPGPRRAPGFVVRFRRFVWRRPEWWVAPLSAAAWAALVALAVAGGAGHEGGAAGSDGGHHHHGPAPGTGPPAWAAWAASLGGTGLMVVAMMAPLALPAVRHVALTSLGSRRHRAGALVLAGYLAVWVAAAGALAGVVAAAVAGVGRTATVVLAFGMASGWQLSRVRRRRLRRCARTAPLAPRGWRADRDCVRFGAGLGTDCVVTCWGVMAAAAAAGHGPAVMAALFALQIRERTDPDRWRPRPAAGLVAAVGLAVLVASA